MVNKLRPPRGVPLARALSKLGVCSRTEAVVFIRQGKVRVGTRVVRDPSFLVAPESAAITLEGARVVRETFKCIAFHKPRGLVTTRSDEKGRPTIYSVLEDVGARLIAVGRLDMATTGLLLLTNDTRFAAWLTDPENEVPREYVVTVRGELNTEEAAVLARGVVDEGERLKADSILVRKSSKRETHLLVCLKEGKNREIRRLFASSGHEVTRLKRIAFGGVTLGELEPGKWRALQKKSLSARFPVPHFEARFKRLSFFLLLHFSFVRDAARRPPSVGVGLWALL